MTTTLARPLLGCLVLLTLTAPAAADSGSAPRPSSAPGRSATERASLYSPRIRRATQNYLRLRLLELREADLDRARAVIERRLRVDDLLKDTPARPEDARPRNKHSPRA
ncbi:MAG: hypothetical protein NVSMB64_10500 [Candidatus Velthaea sp.]